ncbi:MAG: S26 family signal peptidase [Firmicutes bacterium]|nr:S26 family signal peptidase [Bacillota bacterium]
MKKIISGIMISLTIMIAGLSISIMFMGASAYKNNELVYIFDYSFSIIPTESMIGSAYDSLEPGDMVIIQKSSFEDVEIGDVIVFQDTVEIQGTPSNILIIHRVIGINSDGEYITKGDNPSNSIDPHPVTESSYQGSFYAKVTFIKPIVSLMLSSRSLVFLALIAVLIGLMIWELAHMYKTIGEASKQKTMKKNEAELEEFKKIEQAKIYQEIVDEEKLKNDQKNK